MAYGLHELKITGIDVLSIESCVIEGAIGQHTTMYLTAVIDNEDFTLYDKKDYQPISLYVEQRVKKESIFNGIITEIQIFCTAESKQIQVTAKSYSYLMDIDRKSRSFQDITMKYSTLVNKVMLGYEGAKTFLQIPDSITGKLIVQYEETDWEFLKRILSELEVPLTPASEYAGLYVYAGVPKLNKHKIDFKLLKLQKDLSTYYYLKANKQKVQDLFFMKYTIETDKLLHMHERVFLSKQNFTIRYFCYQFLRSQMKAVYQVQKTAGLKRKVQYPMHLIGVALRGTVIGIQQDKVQVHLDIDHVSNKSRSHWFPYSTVSASKDGSGWYCMPEKGDVVRVYFPSKYTDEAIALSAVSNYKVPKGVGVADKMQDTNTKLI